MQYDLRLREVHWTYGCVVRSQVTDDQNIGYVERPAMHWRCTDETHYDTWQAALKAVPKKSRKVSVRWYKVTSDNGTDGSGNFESQAVFNLSTILQKRSTVEELARRGFVCAPLLALLTVRQSKLLLI